MEYLEIIQHYENCFKQHGDTALGVDWTKPEQVNIRYQVMLDISNYHTQRHAPNKPITLLDYGCGLSHLYQYIKDQGLAHIHYSGLEISEIFYKASKAKYPQTPYFLLNILYPKAKPLEQTFDYIVMNGVFTEKRNLSYSAMFAYFKQVLHKVYPLAREGLAFNLMSKQVDFEKEFLFHVPLDELAQFLTQELSRNFIIRNDYGLYEYTVYLFK